MKVRTPSPIRSLSLSDKNRSRNFVEWMSENGESPAATDEEYRRKTRLAHQTYAAALPTYGENAERLAGLGLSVSGYADYMARAAGAAKQKSLLDARNELDERRAALQSGYQQYLKNYAAEQERKLSAVTEKISKSRMFDPETAYRYAAGEGLADEAAHIAAQYGTSGALKNAKEQAARYIFSRELTPEEARLYGKNLGLSRHDADDLAAYAEECKKTRTQFFDMIDGMSNADFLALLSSIYKNNHYYAMYGSAE